MRKLFLPVLLLLLLISCSDGDLQIESIDFNSASVQFCTTPQTGTSNILFKISEDEALILDLQSGALDNGVVGETISTSSSVPGQSTLTYRIFSDGVSSSYFCDDIPPATPTVVDEIEAEDGIILIETVANDDSTEFVHTISLSEISFVNSSGERITNLTIDEFGEVTTEITN